MIAGNLFKKASKRQAKLRLALIGISGSGKTYSALQIATQMGGPIALIDTERGSASKYADLFDFDVVELESFAPARYIEAIHVANQAGYNLLIIDSLSHAWIGKDGVLEFVDKRAKLSLNNNTFLAWRDASPLHNDLVDAMLGCKCHLIVTMRAKTEYVMEEVTDKSGRKKVVPRKVGTQAVQREGLEYEFDLCGELDIDNNLIITKSRCQALSGQVIRKPGQQIAEVLKQWLETGTAREVDLTVDRESELVLSDNRAELIEQIREILPKAHTTELRLNEQVKKRFARDDWQILSLSDLTAVLTGLKNEVRECQQLIRQIQSALVAAPEHDPAEYADLDQLSKKELKALLSQLDFQEDSLDSQTAG